MPLMDGRACVLRGIEGSDALVERALGNAVVNGLASSIIWH